MIAISQAHNALSPWLALRPAVRLAMDGHLDGDLNGRAPIIAVKHFSHAAKCVAQGRSQLFGRGMAETRKYAVRKGLHLLLHGR